MEQTFLASIFEDLPEDKIEDLRFRVDLMQGHFLMIFRELLDGLKDFIETLNNDRSGQLYL